MNGAAPGRIRVEPVRREWAEALSHGDAEFTKRFAVPVERDWAGFPEALPIIIAAAQGDEPDQWGPHLFFGDDGALIGNGGWKGPPVDSAAELGYAAYVSIRRATARHGTLDQQARTALMLVTAAADASPYALAIISLLALRSGWREDQVKALLAGQPVGEDKLDALTGVIGEAAANSGRVRDATWRNAAAQGWGDEQLAEAFAYLGLTVFTSYFLNYAATELDVPAGPARAGEGA